jgi:hypothetical protein
MKSTNYYNAFIAVAEDCAVPSARVPTSKREVKTVAELQFELIYEHPYQYDSDEVLFRVYAERKGIPKNQLKEEKERFFSKGQPCFRASPLTKKYGWGLHSNAEGKIALYALESPEYRKFLNDRNLNHVRAMRSSRKA